MTDTQLALMADTRLSSRARMAGLYLSEIADSDEGVEVRSEVFEQLLGRSWDALRADLRSLETMGWIERNTQTGKGHSPSYRFLAYAHSPPQAELRVAFLHMLKDSISKSTTLNTFSIGGSGTVKRTVDDDEVIEEEVEERAGEAASSEKLAGCRGALKDYLAAKVDPRLQHAYVQTLIGWLDGTDVSVWKKPDGTTLKGVDRTHLLASALNELGATDETKYKQHPGNPANLKTKMNILLRQAHNGTPRPRGRSTKSGFDADQFDRAMDEARERQERE